MDSLRIANIYEKLNAIEDSCQKAFKKHIPSAPRLPARDAKVLHVREHPPKKSLSLREGQARLLHDLASIELQAMELGLRTLIEFPDAPVLFREQLIDIILSESRHLKLCLQGIEQIGFKWGDWPVQIGLWEATAADDSLLDRILIVHRYLEGSGLDAGAGILWRLQGLHAPEVDKALKVIVDEEVGHVLFGSEWYRKICAQQERNPEIDFKERLMKVAFKIPKRLEKLNHTLRRAAGFEDFEIDALEKLQQFQRAPGLDMDKLILQMNS